MRRDSSTESVSRHDAKILSKMDDILAEIAAIRRNMKKKDAEIQRSHKAIQRNLGKIRASRLRFRSVLSRKTPKTIRKRLP